MSESTTTDRPFQLSSHLFKKVRVEMEMKQHQSQHQACYQILKPIYQMKKFVKLKLSQRIWEEECFGIKSTFCMCMEEMKVKTMGNSSTEHPPTRNGKDRK